VTRLLLINPNISDSVSALIRAEADRSASPGTEIEVVTAPFGVAYIETRFEALIGAYAVAQLAAEHHARFDAVIVAAFGDPGLGGLREALPCPVTGLTEAALASACLLGGRFSIVAISQRIRAWYRETVQHYGLQGRLASIRALDEPLADIGNVQGDQASVCCGWRSAVSTKTAPTSSCWPGRRWRACRVHWRAGCRCPRSTACPARCGMPSRWSRCGLCVRDRAATGRRRPSRTRACPSRSRACSLVHHSKSRRPAESELNCWSGVRSIACPGAAP